MRLWIPGPTQVRDEILAECARPMIGHRSKAMAALHERIDPHLALCFGLDTARRSRVAVHTASASGLLEAALHGVGARVLVAVNGAFSRRWLDMARLLGKDARVLECSLGGAPSAQELEQALDRHAPCDALALAVSETSTGATLPLERLARARAAHPATHFLIDVVSYAAGGPVDFDAHGLDFALAGSQKALALPPGLTVACASERYLEAARSRPRPSWYLDPVRIFEGHAKRETPATPAISLYYALARQLEDISRGIEFGASAPAAGAAAWRARFERHRRMAQRVQRWSEPYAARGLLESLPEPKLRGPTVASFVTSTMDVPRFLQAVEARGHKLSNGYGPLKDKGFRIGHMGDHLESHLEQLLQAMDEALA